MHVNLTSDPLGQDQEGEPVYLRDIWPTSQEVREVVDGFVEAKMFTKGYADVFAGDENWKGLDVPSGDMFAWQASLTYVRSPSFFDGMPRDPEPLQDIVDARVLVQLGDSVTTDHI
jgi:aconitate hydratase